MPTGLDYPYSVAAREFSSCHSGHEPFKEIGNCHSW